MVEQTSLDLACPTDLSAYDLEDDSAICEEEPRAQNVNCGSYVFKNTTGVHIGDRTYYTAPVTFVLPNGKGIKEVEEIPTIDGTLAVKSSTVLCEPKDTPPGKKFWEFVSQWLKSPRNIGIAVCGTALVFAAVFIITFYSIRNKGEAVHVLNDRNDTLLMRSRSEWGAKSPQRPVNDLKIVPAPLIIISHTGGSLCRNLINCSESVRSIQRGAMTNSEVSDIPYNFLVGGDGHVFEGRGWDKEGAHTRGYNDRSIGISFMGNFMTQPPSKQQVTAAKALIDEGVLLGTVDPNYKLFAHRQLSKTQSPGTFLYNELKTWPHWSQDTS